MTLAVLLKYARYVSFAVSIILIVRMLSQYRKIRTVSRRNCVIAIVFPVATLLVYSVLIGSSVPAIVLSALLAFGLALGLWQGRSTNVWVESGRPRAQNTVRFLVVWAVSYALMQVMVHLGSQLSLNVGIATMCASTTIAVGSQGWIMMRLSRPTGLPVRVAAAAAAPSESRNCRVCGAGIVSGDRFCRACGAGVR